MLSLKEKGNMNETFKPLLIKFLQVVVYVFLLTCSFVLSAQNAQITILEICSDESGQTSCSDGIDNDGDGLVDCLDDGCNIICLKCDNKSFEFWELIANPQAICADEEITIDILDLPDEIVDIKWSTGVANTEFIVVPPYPDELTYSVTLISAEGCIETKSITLEVVNQDVQVGITTNKIDKVNIDGVEKSDRLFWCSEWSTPMKLEVSKVTPEANTYNYKWSNGLEISKIFVSPSFPEETYWVDIIDLCGNSTREYFTVEWLQCPCAGDPVHSPKIAPTANSCDEDFNRIGGLFNCRRCGTGCTETFNGKLYTKKHKGVDIKGEIHDAVYAMADGTVIRSAYICQKNERYSFGENWTQCSTSEPTGDSCGDQLGNQIKISSDIDGFGTTELIYGHLTKLFVKCGDKVKKGQVIGSMGRTGNYTDATITHVHIQATSNGSLINVEDILATKFTIVDDGDDSNDVNYVLCSE